MSMKLFIQTHLAQWPLGVDQTSPNILCPECGGGYGKEKSFSITQRPEGVLYNCYRATCDQNGGFISMGTILAPNKRKKEFKPKPYTDDLRRLNAEERRWFVQKFGLTLEEIGDAGIKYNPMRDTYVFPIFDWRGYQVGVVDRAYWGRKPKSISYWFNDCVKVHFPGLACGSTTEDPILLVEDQMSGIKANKFMDTAVLLGTNFNYEMATYMRTLTDSLVIALDADATQKAIEYKRKYNVMFRNFHVIQLSKDVKDMSNDEIEEMLDGLIWLS